CGVAEKALLLNRSGFGVTLRDDEAAQGRAVLARNLLPDRLAVVVTEADAAIFFRVGKKNSPAIFRHAHVAERGPALSVHADRRTEINVGSVEVAGSEAVPPVEKFGLPMFESAL